MICCAKKNLFVTEPNSWFSRCRNCGTVFLESCQPGFKYFKVQCAPETSRNVASIQRRPASYPYYRIPVDAVSHTCKCCYREFVVEDMEFNRLFLQNVYFGRLVESRYFDLKEKVNEMKKKFNTSVATMEQLRTERKALEQNKEYYLEKIKQAEMESGKLENTLKKMEEKGGTEDKKMLEQIQKENQKLRYQSNLLKKLRDIRQIAPEITYEIIEIANVKKEIAMIRPLVEQKQVEIATLKPKYQAAKDECERLTKQSMEATERVKLLEEQKKMYENDCEKLQELGNIRKEQIETARKNYEEADDNASQKCADLNKLLDVSMIKILDFLEETKDFQEAQERQKKSPLYQLMPEKFKNLDTDSFLNNMKNRAKILYMKDCRMRGSRIEAPLNTLTEEVVYEDMELQEDEVFLDAKGAFESSASFVTTESISHKTDTSLPRSESSSTETDETSSMDSFEVIKDGSEPNEEVVLERLV